MKESIRGTQHINRVQRLCYKRGAKKGLAVPFYQQDISKPLNQFFLFSLRHVMHDTVVYLFCTTYRLKP